MEHRPLILTARMDAQAQAHFQALRTLYFPPERNFIPAHLTLFNHLPPSLLEEACDVLKAMVAHTPILKAQVRALRFLGRGVAYDIYCPDLHHLRAELAERWLPLLTPQDKAPMRAHVTVQNKVTAQVAKTTFTHLQAEFVPRAMHITGLDLHYYEGGPWSPIRGFSFRGMGNYSG